MSSHVLQRAVSPLKKLHDLWQKASIEHVPQHFHHIIAQIIAKIRGKLDSYHVTKPIQALSHSQVMAIQEETTSGPSIPILLKINNRKFITVNRQNWKTSSSQSLPSEEHQKRGHQFYFWPGQYLFGVLLWVQCGKLIIFLYVKYIMVHYLVLLRLI